jgi:hypothetical protein
MDIWWHIMFYLAMLSYYFGFKSLVKLGNTEVVNTQEAFINGKNWGIFTVILLAIIFITPNSFESVVSSYTSSRLGEVGAHHFIALVVSGVVGAYLFGAKAFLGQLGRAIASPMLIAVWALSFLHFWELLAESWKVIEVSDDMIEGVEKIFLTITAICIIYAANRLKAMSQS